MVGGGARLVRAHGGEKSRAPHPPRYIRGGAKEVWKGTIYPVCSLSLPLIRRYAPLQRSSFKRGGINARACEFHHETAKISSLAGTSRR